MKDYQTFYQKISKPFLKKSYQQALYYTNKVLTMIMYIAYPALLIYLFYTHSVMLVKTILIPAISFLLLSLVRDYINSPRPYEKYSIKPLIHKDTKGHSMPSRHVFSSAIIAMCFIHQNSLLGGLLLLITLIEAYIRVVGGVHFVKDVVVGLLIGIGCGLLLWI